MPYRHPPRLPGTTSAPASNTTRAAARAPPRRGAGRVGMVGTPDGGDARQRHVPVLRERCVALLAPALLEPGSVVVDATLGLGGHSEALLERCPEATLVGIDRDPQAL